MYFWNLNNKNNSIFVLGSVNVGKKIFLLC